MRGSKVEHLAICEVNTVPVANAIGQILIFEHPRLEILDVMNPIYVDS
jgi:hypothetical protein